MKETRSTGNAAPLGAGDLRLDAWGVQKVSTPFSLFHGLWSYDIPPSMWFMYHNGVQVYSSSNITSVHGAANLQTSATNSTLLMESRECPRYQPNRGHLFSTAGWFPNKTSDGTRDFGLFTDHDGVFFRLKSDGKLYAVLRRAGAEVREEEIDTSNLTGFDVEKNNIYDIQFQWRGAGNYAFFIGDPGTGTSRLVHKFNLLGTLTRTSLDVPAMPLAYKATRGTQDVFMGIGCADLTSENGQIAPHQYNSAYAENVSVNGTDSPCIVLKLPLTIGGEVNTRTVQLARISFTCSKKAVFKVWTTRNGADITGATFASLGGGSYLETDSPNVAAGAVRATALTTANMRRITAVPVEAAVAREVTNPQREKIVFPLVRGDHLVVSVTASTAYADVVIEVGEQI